MKKVTKYLLTTLITLAVFGCSKTQTNEVIVSPSFDVTGKVKLDDKLISVKKVEKLKFANSQVITLQGPVTEESTSSIIEQIKEKQNQSSIYLLIDSPGGSVIDGALLISAMEASKVPVYTVCLKLCASMAFMIHQYGAKRYMIDRSILMAHPASGGGRMGQLENQASLLNTIRRYIDKLNNKVAKRLNMSDEEFRNHYAYELWIDAEDSTQKGLNDGIVSLSYSVKASPVELDGSAHESLRNFKWQ